MSEIRQISGSLDGTGKRVAIVASRFNGRLVEGLLDGALEALRGHGVAERDLLLVRVPGAWEIPQALEAIAARGDHDALVALGVVIRGETAHFEYISAECSRGIARVAERHHLAVGFGVLTCENEEQAAARAGGKGANKGREAALAALETADVLAQLGAARSHLATVRGEVRR